MEIISTNLKIKINGVWGAISTVYNNADGVYTQTAENLNLVRKGKWMPDKFIDNKRVVVGVQYSKWEKVK